MVRRAGPPKKKKIRARRSNARVASSPPSHFVNRELSWLEFNRRVLCEARSPLTPLLERVRFLSIVTSNLDEFFMKRVGGLKQQIAAGVLHTTPDGMTPQQELTAIREAVIPLLKQQAECYEQEILPALRENGVALLRWKDLREQEQRSMERFYKTQTLSDLDSTLG